MMSAINSLSAVGRAHSGGFLTLVVDAKITILTKSFCIKSPIVMAASESHLSSTFRVVAILAHTISIVFFIMVAAFKDVFSMFMNSLRLRTFRMLLIVY
jgi:hypothetical protein